MVSVVTPVYDGMPFLERCIRSVLEQTFDQWEYVILDNASGDGSLSLARRFAERDSRIKVEQNETTVPFVRNWNRALECVSSRSKYIKVVHADDWIYPECLDQMVGLAERHPGTSIIGAWVERGGEITCRWEDAPGEVVDGRELARLSLLGRIPYLFGSPTSILMRADAVRAAMPLYEEDEVRIIGQVVDQDACYQLLGRGDFGYVPRVLTVTREHEDSITAQNEQVARWYPGKIALHLRYGPVFLNDQEYERRLDQWLDRYYRFLGKALFRSRDSEFWSFHREALEDLGLELKISRLIVHAASETLRRAKRGIDRRIRGSDTLTPGEARDHVE